MKFVLTNWNEIEVSEISIDLPYSITINSEKGFYCNATLISKLIYKLEKDIELGSLYFINLNNNNYVINTILSSQFNDFDDKYAYLGNDLGPTYQKDRVSFKLWSPLAYKVEILIYENFALKDLFLMQKQNCGVFSISLKKINGFYIYKYKIYIDDFVNEVVDPYSKMGLKNCSFSVANGNEDLEKIEKIQLKPLNNNEICIYEGNVRDLTISDFTNIQNKGKFLGLAESGRKTNNGEKAGLDYIKALGISHLQLLPIFKVATVDEADPKNTYNWGYDSQHFFILESSYSTDYKNPYSPIVEFQSLVKRLHEENIRIVIDVVYNHIYKSEISNFEKVVPGYYIRQKSGKIQKYCGCGGDFASERTMGRKIILDSVLYLINQFDIDGIRIDLMGLLDVKTINEIANKSRKLKKDFLIYGEGWNMGGECFNKEELSILENASLLKNVGFFNDRLRNIYKGLGTSTKLQENGFFLGNDDFYNGFLFAFRGSTTDITYPKLFTNSNLSINYLECHDNATLYDTIKLSLPNFIETDVLKILSLFNCFNSFTFGIPFVHAGQEFGQTKYNSENSYNLGDKYNALKYELIKERKPYIDSFINSLKIRHKYAVFQKNTPESLSNDIKIAYNNGLIEINIDDSEKSLLIFLNNKILPLQKEINNNLKLVFQLNENSDDFKNSIISPLSILIFEK